MVQGRGDRVDPGFSHTAFICIKTSSGPISPIKVDAKAAYKMYGSQFLLVSLPIFCRLKVYDLVRMLL